MSKSDDYYLTPNGEPGAQAQPVSTALLALVKVAAHHGLSLDAQQIVRSNPFTTAEPTSALLLKIAQQAGLKGRRMQVKRGDLASVAKLAPLIMLQPDGRAALIKSIQSTPGASVALVDQFDSGREISALYDEPRLYESWNGDLIALRLPFLAAGTEPPFGFGWILKQVYVQRKLFRDISIAALMTTFLSLVPPLTMMVMVDRVLVSHSESTLFVMTVAVLAAILFETIFGFLRRQLTLIASSHIDARINIYVFDKLLNLPMSFFERMSTGMINGKIGQVWRIRDFMTNQLFGTLLDSVMLAVLVPVLFILNWKLAFGVVALAFLMFVIYFACLPGLRRRHGVLIRAEQAMGSHQVESIYGIRTIKSLCLDGLKRYQRDIRVAEVVKSHRDFDSFANIPQTLVHPLDRLIYVGSFLVGCYMAFSDSSGGSIGSIVAFPMLAARIASPIVELANLLNTFEQARGALGEVASVVNVPPEEGRSGLGLKLPITGRIIFQDVKFRYSPGAPYALNGVSFEIPQGTIFGIMGRSGSGKTTVTRLLQGLNRDYEGMVKVDGMDLREIDLDHLRSNIGVVPQENFLFSGTIRDNISAPRPKATFDRIVRAAQLAGAEEFIERMPRGYDTVVEEGAVNFSGGQRQRLAIARALLVDPAILVLDEATSALDAESEAIVNANLMRIASGRTVIIISHRLASLVTADAILVLERGKFYDVGHHRDLVKNCDIYRMLWKQQNRHLEMENDDVDANIESRKPSKALASPALTFESATAEVLAEHHPVLERATLFTLALMVALFFVFISVKKLDRVVTATGRIVPTSGTLTVQPLEKQIISHIYVSPGDVVKKGQILAACDPTFVNADLAAAQAKVDSLLAQKRRMEDEESGKRLSSQLHEPDDLLQGTIRQKRENEYRSGVNDFDQRISGTEADIAGLKDNIADYSARLKIESDQENMYNTLEQQQVTSHLQSMVQKDQRLETQRLLATAKNSLDSELHTLESLKEQRKVFAEKWHDDNLNGLVDIKSQLDAAQDDLAKARKMSDLIDLRAPADAIVLKIPDLSQGAVAADAEPLFSLIPLDAPMEVDVAIDAKDSGFVRVGDQVRIKLDAFQFMEHGIAEGVVKTISQDSFTEAATQDALTRTNYNRPSTETVAPYFDTRIKLTAVKLHNVPPNTRLTPGMTVQADIVVGHRTILWYILGSALRSGAEGMREP